MDRSGHQDVRIGTLAPLEGAQGYLRQLLPHGFECFQLTMRATIGGLDLPSLATEVKEVLRDRAAVSSLGLYGNPLTNEETARDWATVIRSAGLFGAKFVCGFAGALEDRPVDESIPRFAEVFGELAKVAEGEGVKIGFENCDMGGTWERPKWNIAHSPRAWELMFDAVPSDALGLEWEPCHQMVSFIEPVPQLRQWVGKVVHIHGKDATIAWDVVRREGTRCGKHVVQHRTPGFGDTNWADVISVLRSAGWRGSIDIEGWHDPVYRGDLEMTGQVYGLNYLKGCRGGPYVPNPATA
ncbi:MAG: sugar phosphate isomerase/epimerase [Fimbriimonadaceae bacterium]|nr:sugar phosphate isomerase/epimerase [Fimbriimonadaceae bacterium]